MIQCDLKSEHAAVNVYSYRYRDVVSFFFVVFMLSIESSLLSTVFEAAAVCGAGGGLPGPG